MSKGRIVIGLPMFQDVSPENKVDFGRLMFCLGRHYGDWDFSVAYRSKAEQFRARNFIVEKAREVDATYLLFMDDDHIIDWIGRAGNAPYMFLQTLIGHMENDPELGIVGALYYQRGGGMYKPVLMHDTAEGHGIFYDDHEIEGKLQEVDIQGGGVMLLRMKMFDKMKDPYFQPETLDGRDRQGTDLQICRKARDLGWKVACDTGIVIGHEHSNRIVVSPKNRHLCIEDAHQRGIENIEAEIAEWQKMVLRDAMEYLNMPAEAITSCSAEYYTAAHRARFHEYKNPDDYYRSIGDDQICRQITHHRKDWVAARDVSIVNMMRTPKRMTGLDFGCGIGIVGFEALRMDNHVDFVDVENTAAYDFLKWRVIKYQLGSSAGFTLSGPYDFVLLLDVIEHLLDWEYTLDNIVGRMNPGAAIITNLFTEEIDPDDPEHLHVDKKGVADFFLDRGLLPSHMGLWIKRDNFLGGPKNVRNFRKKDDRGSDSAVGKA